jgi:hypothetical protein
MSSTEEEPDRPPLPPFTAETALKKVNAAEAAWNRKDVDAIAAGRVGTASRSFCNSSCFKAPNDESQMVLVTNRVRPGSDNPSGAYGRRHQLLTAGIVHVTNLTPGSECNPTRGVQCRLRVAQPRRVCEGSRQHKGEIANSKKESSAKLKRAPSPARRGVRDGHTRTRTTHLTCRGDCRHTWARKKQNEVNLRKP